MGVATLTASAAASRTRHETERMNGLPGLPDIDLMYDLHYHTACAGSDQEPPSGPRTVGAPRARHDVRWTSLQSQRQAVQAMEISARNQFKGRVTSINRGGVVAEVTGDIGNCQEMVSVITNGSVERLRPQGRSEVTAILQATAGLAAKH